MIPLIVIALLILGAWAFASTAKKSDSVSACKDVDLVELKLEKFRVWVNVNYRQKFYDLLSYIVMNCPEVKRIDSFNCARIPGYNTWSYHSYGLAIDVNPTQFPMVSDVSKSYGIPDWFLDLAVYAQAIGFTWGGTWREPWDPMHFQIGKREPVRL